MSFDLFVFPLPDSNWRDAERHKIIEILYRNVERPEKFWDVCYPDESGAWDFHGLEDWNADTNRGLHFTRFGGRTFADRLYEIADRLDAMVVWPDEPPMVAVTRQDLFVRLPEGLKPGDAVVVRDADELMARICG